MLVFSLEYRYCLGSAECRLQKLKKDMSVRSVLAVAVVAMSCWLRNLRTSGR